MRALLLAGVLAATAAAPAHAAWSPVTTVPGSAAPANPSVAINAHGAAAVAWTNATNNDNAPTVIRVAVRRSANARFSAAVLRRRTYLAVSGLTVVVDKAGETTVAWVERTNTRGLLHGRIAVRAAFRRAGGHWSHVQTIAYISPFAYAFPRLAAAPDDRRVVLTFNAGNRRASGMAAAWRRPGHAFGSAHDLNTGPRGSGYLFEATLQFDVTGRAYLAGIRDCDSGHSAGELLSTAPGGSRFINARIAAAPPASAMRLAVTGLGRAVLAWGRSSCSTTEGIGGGPLSVANVAGGAPGTPVPRDPMGGFAIGAVAGPGGTAEVWTMGFAASGGYDLQATRSDAHGVFGPAFVPADGLVPVVADGYGDQLVGLADGNWLSVGGDPTDLRARAADGTITSPPLPAGRAGVPAAAAPIGPGLAVVIAAGGHLRFARWTP